MASNPNLQNSFLQKGTIWHLLTFMFSYDYTLEECGVERSEEANNQVNYLLNFFKLIYIQFNIIFQEVLNRLAKLSVKACARLGGYYEGDLSTPENAIAKCLFVKLLTPYVAEQLSEESPHQVIIVLYYLNKPYLYLIYTFSFLRHLAVIVRHPIWFGITVQELN